MIIISLFHTWALNDVTSVMLEFGCRFSKVNWVGIHNHRAVINLIQRQKRLRHQPILVGVNLRHHVMGGLRV